MINDSGNRREFESGAVRLFPCRVTKDVDLCAECSAQLMKFMENPEVILVSDILLKKEERKNGKNR